MWEGKADIPRLQANRSGAPPCRCRRRCSTSGPGLYALIATAGRRHAGRARGGADDSHRSGAHRLARLGRADGAGARLLRRAGPGPACGSACSPRTTTSSAEATTDADGVARFAAPLLHGTGPMAPRSIHVFGREDDFIALDLDEPPPSTSRTAASTGQPHPGPLDAFVWLDRGIYRPGETVQVMALLRDAAGQPPDIPARLRVRRPNGQVFPEPSPPRPPSASVHLPVTLSRRRGRRAPGSWRCGPTRTRRRSAGPSSGSTPSCPTGWRSTSARPLARSCPGSPSAAGRRALPLRRARRPACPARERCGSRSTRPRSPALTGFRIGLEGENYAPDRKEIDLPDTDAQGTPDAADPPAAGARHARTR